MRTSGFLCQTLGDADTGRRCGKATLAGLPQIGGEQTAHAAHGINDFIAGDGVIHPRKRHIGAGNGVHGTNNIALDAGHLHQTGHRVADQAQQVAAAHCSGVPPFRWQRAAAAMALAAPTSA